MAGAGLSAVMVFIAAVQGSPATRTGPNPVAVTCDRPELVAGKPLHIIRFRDPRSVGDLSSVESPAHHPPSYLRVELPRPPRFSKQGACTVRLREGRYRFEVLYRNAGTIVALSSGDVEVKKGEPAEIVLKSGTPRTVKLSYTNTPLRVTHTQVRVRGWRPLVKWNDRDNVHFIRESVPGGTAPLSVVLSPGEKVPVRLLATGTIDGREVAVAWWGSLASDKTTLDLSDREMFEANFAFQGSDEELARIPKAELTVHLPENDTLKVSLRSGLLITNRRFIETSTLYETTSGDVLSFNRRSRVLGRKHTVKWGGELTAKAYARMTMSWNKETPRSLIWGAYLHTDSHDVLNTWEPPKKNAVSSDTWEKDKKYNTIPLARIDWKETLVRTDGGEMPADPLWMTEPYVKEQFPDLNELGKVFKVRASYRLGGERVERELPLSRWVTWKSKRLRIEAPPEWDGRARSYLDKAERVMDYCAPVSKYIPEGIQIFWTNNKMAGYTCGPKSLKRIQMGVFDLRRRQDLFTTLAIMAHEQLHAHGYGHGAEHDRLIRQSNTWFLQHHQALADHPEYVPYPVTRVPEIESVPNDYGALGYKPNLKIRTTPVRTARKPARRGGLGLGRAKKPAPGKAPPVASGVAERAWIGMRLRKDGSLLAVAEVAPHSPASKANLEAGTRIFSVQGKVVTDVESVRALLKRIAPRGSVRMTVLHHGKEHSVEIRADKLRPGVSLGPDEF